jgi:hypothetical protein
MFLANQARNCSQQDLASFIQSSDQQLRIENLLLQSNLETLTESVNAAFHLSRELDNSISDTQFTKASPWRMMQ